MNNPHTTHLTPKTAKSKTLARALGKAVAGSVISAAKAHPDKLDEQIAGSIAKRIVGQILAQFEVKQKIRQHNG